MWFCDRMGVCCNSPYWEERGVRLDDLLGRIQWEHIEYTFAAFCKVVLRNTATEHTIFRAETKQEVSLEYIISETLLEPFTTDTYFEQYDQPTVFVVKGQAFVVANKRLADALLKLTDHRRNVLFLYYFFGYTDAQIGKKYGRSRSTANYWKLAALKQLRKNGEIRT